jgi:NAD(P)-dependent dehydrogenase (short-subunit alcohol dehydrogenase family)
MPVTTTGRPPTSGSRRRSFFLQGRIADPPLSGFPVADLSGKIALITGAASGIGRAGARAFAAAGAAVVVADLNEKNGRAVVAELGDDKAMFQPLDVRSSEQVQAAVAATVARFGRIDALFHNAMNVPLVNREDTRATELVEGVWREIIDLVLTGTFLCCKYVGQQMLKQKSGSLILTATTDALIGQAGLDAYTAAKGGVVALTRSLAAGLSPEGVRVNAVCPSFVETPHQAPFMSDPAERRKIEDLHLMGIMQPEEIADFAVYLASDKAKRMTGGIHVVDAGYTAFKGRMDIKATVAR